MTALNAWTGGVFITGTDTEVGKSLVAAALIWRSRLLGRHTVGFKPVVAGTTLNSQGVRVNEDLETLLLASLAEPCAHPSGQISNRTSKRTSKRTSEQTREPTSTPTWAHPSPRSRPQLTAPSICPFILDEPAAPHLVAQDCGVELNLDVMVESYQRLADSCDAVVVEGAGGFLVPINAHQSLADFAQALNLPVVMVVGMRLGCINHALLTQESIASRGLPLLGWVANCLQPDMPHLEGNLLTLQSQLKAPQLGRIPLLGAEHLNTSAPGCGAYTLEGIAFAAGYLK